MDRGCRAVEDDEEAVPGGVHLPTAVSRVKQAAGLGPMTLQHTAPHPITDSGGAPGRPDHVAEEDGGHPPVDCPALPWCQRGTPDLVHETVHVAEEARCLVARHFDVLAVGQMLLPPASACPRPG